MVLVWIARGRVKQSRTVGDGYGPSLDHPGTGKAIRILRHRSGAPKMVGCRGGHPDRPPTALPGTCDLFVLGSFICLLFMDFVMQRCKVRRQWKG